MAVCARDFVDYDANALAVAAGVPGSAAAANAVLARMDRGACTVRRGVIGRWEGRQLLASPPPPLPCFPPSQHAGRATYVSEVFYNASNCVGGNTG